MSTKGMATEKAMLLVALVLSEVVLDKQGQPTVVVWAGKVNYDKSL